MSATTTTHMRVTGDSQFKGQPRTYAHGARNHKLGGVTHHPLLRVFASCEEVGPKRGHKSKQNRAEQCNRGEWPGWLQVDLFLANLRASPTGYSSQRTKFTTQYPSSLRNPRFYSVIVQGHPSLHFQRPRQSWPGTQHSLLISSVMLGN